MAKKKDQRTRLEKAFDLYREKAFDLQCNPKYEDLPNEEWDPLSQAVDDEFLEQLKVSEEECIAFLENVPDSFFDPTLYAPLLAHFHTNIVLARMCKAVCESFFQSHPEGTSEEETAYYRDLLAQADAVLLGN